MYAAPCAAFPDAVTGDTVEIDAAGNAGYAGDVCAIAASGITITGTNGRAHIDAAGNNAQGKGIWVIQGNDVTVENIELSGATVADFNGAGIRAEGTNLTIRNCYFHDDQDGILGGAGEVLIEFSEFAKNGNCLDPAGCAHNMYLSANVTKFTLRYSYSHSATDGHLVKSRAQQNFILYNRLSGEDGTDSYELSLPNAGTTYVIGNLIEQGPNTGNPAMLDYGSEGASNPGTDLYVVNNTFVNDRSGGTFVSISNVTTPAVVENDIFVGTGTLVSEAGATLAHNFSSGDPLFVDRAAYDYRLLPGSPCIDQGTDPGAAPSGFSLVPTSEYVHPANVEPRPVVGALDIGAYEYGGADASAGAGGTTASGGAAPGGTTSNGGAAPGGGTTSNGGAAPGGGTTSNGGNGGAGQSGSANAGGAGGAREPSSGRDAGASATSGNTGSCGCRAPRGNASDTDAFAGLIAVAIGLLGRARGRRH